MVPLNLPENLVALAESISLFPDMLGVYSYSSACRQLSQFLLAVIFFHFSEYILAVAFHGRSNVTLSSLLITKSYVLAMILALLEYVFEVVMFPGMKQLWWVSNLGLLLVLLGEIIRKSAVLTAGTAFTHMIKTRRDDEHKLVTHGLYGVIRHPGYSGFFIWSVGTQIMLCNPLSTVAFAVVVWKFFAARIPYEEHFLRHFFGMEYDNYARRVPSGVPFVS